MPDQPEQAVVTDPDNIPEILCDGQVNVSVVGNLATLTFTHVRPDVTKMFKDGTIVPRAAVRARIVISVLLCCVPRLVEQNYRGSEYTGSAGRRSNSSLTAGRPTAFRRKPASGRPQPLPARRCACAGGPTTPIRTRRSVLLSPL